MEKGSILVQDLKITRSHISVNTYLTKLENSPGGVAQSEPGSNTARVCISKVFWEVIEMLLCTYVQST
jgi:hypothetical protein